MVGQRPAPCASLKSKQLAHRKKKKNFVRTSSPPRKKRAFLRRSTEISRHLEEPVSVGEHKLERGREEFVIRRAWRERGTTGWNSMLSIPWKRILFAGCTFSPHACVRKVIDAVHFYRISMVDDEWLATRLNLLLFISFPPASRTLSNFSRFRCFSLHTKYYLVLMKTHS